MSEFILCERRDEVALVTLNRPEAMNALNRALFTELREKLADLDSDPDVSVTVLHGAGGRAFCVGVDLKERQSISDQEADLYRRQVVFPFYLFMHERSKPMIAAVDGYCLGGGFELALAADIIVASESSEFGLPETRWGLIPAGGALQVLTRVLGPMRTKELALTGRRMSGPEALATGVISNLVEHGSVVDKAMDIASAISSKVPIAVRGVKRSVDHIVGFREGFDFDIEVSNVCYFSPERKAALERFKKEPVNANPVQKA